MSPQGAFHQKTCTIVTSCSAFKDTVQIYSEKTSWHIPKEEKHKNQWLHGHELLQFKGPLKKALMIDFKWRFSSDNDCIVEVLGNPNAVFSILKCKQRITKRALKSWQNSTHWINWNIHGCLTTSVSSVFLSSWDVSGYRLLPDINMYCV